MACYCCSNEEKQVMSSSWLCYFPLSESILVKSLSFVVIVGQNSHRTTCLYITKDATQVRASFCFFVRSSRSRLDLLDSWVFVSMSVPKHVALGIGEIQPSLLFQCCEFVEPSVLHCATSRGIRHSQFLKQWCHFKPCSSTTLSHTSLGQSPVLGIAWLDLTHGKLAWLISGLLN